MHYEVFYFDFNLKLILLQGVYNLYIPGSNIC